MKKEKIKQPLENGDIPEKDAVFPVFQRSREKTKKGWEAIRRIQKRKGDSKMKKSELKRLPMREKGSARLIKTWSFADGGTREKVVYSGTIRGAKKRIPESKKDQFRIEFKGAK